MVWNAPCEKSIPRLTWTKQKYYVAKVKGKCFLRHTETLGSHHSGGKRNDISYKPEQNKKYSEYWETKTEALN